MKKILRLFIFILLFLFTNSFAGVIDGTVADDNLTGTTSSDTITGFAGNDTIDGLNGNTSIDIAVYTNTFSSYIITNLGNLSYTVADSNGTDGTDSISNIERLQFSDIIYDLPMVLTGATYSAQTIISGDNDDNITTPDDNGGDTITTFAGNDTITSSGVADTIDAGDGDDIIYARGGGDILNGGLGYRHIYIYW